MMMLKQVADFFQVELSTDDIEINGVSTDTRSLEKGDLFVALKGDNFDGHDYVSQAFERGAVAAIVSDKVDQQSNALITVKDTLLALGELAAYWRKQQDIKVIGLTGSNGKTTVKDMLTSIFSNLGNTLSTGGNFNNDIGLPLTLLRIQSEHEYAIIEMGANHAGEIAYLTKLTCPDVAVLNNAGAAHLEGFGSLQGVAEAKGEIFSGLTEKGTAVINIDDQFADYWMSLCDDHKKVFFGLGAASNVTAEFEESKYDGCFELKTVKETMPVCLKVLGLHNLRNALAATAAANALGVELKDIKKGLEKFEGVSGRLQVRKAANDALVIDDTYNANPTSMKAAVDVLASQKGYSVLIMGDMGELGDNSAELHAEVGKYAKEKNINALLTLGALSKNAAEYFGEGSSVYDDKESLIKDVKEKLNKETIVLIKGSRSMKMEEVVSALVADKNTGAC